MSDNPLIRHGVPIALGVIIAADLPLVELLRDQLAEWEDEQARNAHNPYGQRLREILDDIRLILDTARTERPLPHEHPANAAYLADVPVRAVAGGGGLRAVRRGRPVV